jgi:acetoin utilization deacetylase AcuC-like enzyme
MAVRFRPYMANPPVIFSEPGALRLGSVFRPARYGLIKQALISVGWVRADEILTPRPAADSDLLLVHDEAWVRRLRAGLSPEEEARAEAHWSPQLVEGFCLATGGTILAARTALEHGMAFHIGGGFHHAFPDHGEGFCLVNDVAIAIRKLQLEGGVKRVMVVDVDAHQGNGTAAIFAGDPNVFTLSIHEQENYPAVKPPSTIDIGLESWTGDTEYLERLSEAYPPSIAFFAPELLFYVAGSDPYWDDRLCRLGLSMEGLRARDSLVLRKAAELQVPVAIVMAGGYAEDLCDTVAIHLNTYAAAAEAAARATAR